MIWRTVHHRLTGFVTGNTVRDLDSSKERSSKRLCLRRQPVRAMKAVVQRVRSASVEVDGAVTSRIQQGLLAFVGISASDKPEDAEFLCRKILNCRLWPSSSGSGRSWDESVMQRGYEVLVVSQFTLMGYLKGSKPDFHLAMPPAEAKAFYGSFVQRVRDAYAAEKVKDGVFAAMMDVSLVNDGPVTMTFDSDNPKGR